MLKDANKKKDNRNVASLRSYYKDLVLAVHKTFNAGYFLRTQTSTNFIITFLLITNMLEQKLGAIFRLHRVWKITKSAV